MAVRNVGYPNSSRFALPQSLDRGQTVLEWEETELYQRWDTRTGTNPKNDFLILVTPSSYTSGSGSGKTTLGTQLGKRCDRSGGGFNAAEKASLDAGELAYKVLPDVDSGSAVIFDEAQGAPGTTSVNSRRGMTQESLDAITGILANRDKQLTIIMIAQQLGMMDKLIYPMIDAWLLITRDPQQEGGATAVHHRLTMNDYDLDNPQIKTPALESLSWPMIPADDPDYSAMEVKKQKAKRRRKKKAEEETPITELPKKIRDEKIRELAGAGVKQGVIAEAFDLTQQRVSQIVKE